MQVTTDRLPLLPKFRLGDTPPEDLLAGFQVLFTEGRKTIFATLLQPRAQRLCRHAEYVADLVLGTLDLDHADKAVEVLVRKLFARSPALVLRDVRLAILEGALPRSTRLARLACVPLGY